MTPGMTLHVIYGIACAGKSTTALQYASDNGIRTVISTDYLREVQRLYVPANESPALAKVSHTAWEMTGAPTPGGIIAGFTSHAEAVFPAVAAVAAKLAHDGLDAVIEGSCFHGALITRLRQQDRDVTIRPVLLTVESLPQLLDHITEKEQQRAGVRVPELAGERPGPDDHPGLLDNRRRPSRHPADAGRAPPVHRSPL
jgi:2-phosphoglycerate kinase